MIYIAHSKFKKADFSNALCLSPIEDFTVVMINVLKRVVYGNYIDKKTKMIQSILIRLDNDDFDF